MNRPLNRTAETTEKCACYHCGDTCVRGAIVFHGHNFCCEGCKMVFELLSEKGMCDYYDLADTPGISRRKPESDSVFSALNDPEVSAKILRYQDDELARVVFSVPLMHCTSCIWLLEHLHRLNAGIISSVVNFPRKEVTIDFRRKDVQLSEVAELLTRVGYPPSISLENLEEQLPKKKINSRIIKIGVAGFCFGNIMLLSFPEYLGAGELAEQPGLKLFFGLLSLALALPVLVYCASEFFTSAWKALRQMKLNIDAPIALAITITFSRSVYEILTNGETSYLDSMSGIVFFMLIGRYFQDRSYQSISFERDYKSYFPIAVTVLGENSSENIPVTKLKKGDRIIIRNNELVPADAILCSSKTYVDYSFVTGEAQPVRKATGDVIYAGARQSDGAAEYKVVKPTSQSYLTQLWNNDAFSSKNRSARVSYVDRINLWFTVSLFLVAGLAALTWLLIDPAQSLSVFTAVLIVACPCTLLLASTFTNGAVLRWLGRSGFYLKNADVIEQLATADTIVFDKTGTITNCERSEVQFEGGALNADELNAVVNLAAQSGHPLSRRIVSALPPRKGDAFLTDVREVEGRGISGVVNGLNVAIGSADFAGQGPTNPRSTEVWVAIDGKVKGKFHFANKYRDGLANVAGNLSQAYALQLLSGDNGLSRQKLEPLLGKKLFYSRSPQEKLDHIKQLQTDGHRVIMIGDGLNDAGALMQSDAGIVISDNLNNYFPACDAILDGNRFQVLPQILEFTRVARKVLVAAFIVSVIYNCIGLSFAVAGLLDPLIAAVLMPASSLSVILISSLSVRWAAHRMLPESAV